MADDTELANLYGYPDELHRPWVSVNFICSADGGVSVAGRSGGLGDANDKRIFLLGRTLADVILVGATTALVERYRGAKRTSLDLDRRRDLGLAELPPIAVVTKRCSVDPSSLVVSDTEVPPIILTTVAAPDERKTALRNAGAEVVEVGETDVDPAGLLIALNERGLRRVNCEGGPTLFGSLAEAGLVDQLCLNMAPMLVGGETGRIISGPAFADPQRMRLASVLHADNLLMLRYLRQ